MAGEKNLALAGGTLLTPSATVTRPADTTAYGSGDLIANSTTAGDVTAMSFTAALSGDGAIKIRRARVYKDDDDVTNATFRLHLFDADPTGTAPTNGDNGAIALTGVTDNSLGAFDLAMTTTPDIHTDGNVGFAVPITGSEINVLMSSNQTIYGLLEARAAYTPASGEVFTVVLEVWQD